MMYPFSCILVVYPKLVLFLIPLQFVYLFLALMESILSFYQITAFPGQDKSDLLQ